ncbi:hypothetical protein JCM21714_4065 [Gracilibacillus boraciitolerans JCM 21714]|uniref:Uncharacterized protein n=1 Tax=Gracilibacillus boraciitolerans JCM 21714 TaxID=1298598 RepID=W4VNW3_9BACI|nr:hypothetical protein [Gracilibacillus boraciitolerans]GAE94866.1 hypothetical protein JCM21714_4065 [Gracilibacillus boraciitolerans JCM 21714]
MRNIFNRKIVIFIVVLILSVIAQFFSVSLIFGLSISFAPIIYFSCIRIFGSRFSLLLVVMMSIVTYYLHFNNLSVFLSIAEVLVIGWFYSKKAKDLFTWSFVYSLIIFALYLIIITLLVDYISIPQTVTNFLLLQTVTATLFSALVADIFYDYAPFIPKLKYFFKASRRVYFGQVIAHLLIFFAVFPILIVILVTSQGMEQNMMQEYQNDYLRLESRLQTKITEMDSTEIQNHELDSLLEKAKIKSMLQDYIGLTDKRIYMLDQKNQVWLDMHSENTNIPDLNEIKQGYVKKIHSDGFIWLSTNSNHLFDWYRAYYIAETSFLNKQTFLVIPTFYLVNEVIENLLDYLIFVLFVLFVSLVFGMIVNHVLSKSLIRLTQLTSDLPEKMERQETFYWDDTNINEFSTLGDNIKKVANQLQSMFLEAKKKMIC